MESSSSNDAFASGEFKVTTTDSHDEIESIKFEPLESLNNVCERENADKINNNIPKQVIFSQEGTVNNLHETKRTAMNKSGEYSEFLSNSATSSSSFDTAKELLTSFSRSLGGSLFTQPLPCNIQLNSKFGSIFERLSSIGEEISDGFPLPNFVVAGIESNLNSLGVEEIDCKEQVEAWLSHRRQKRWKKHLEHQTQTLDLFRKEFTMDSYSSCAECFQNLLAGKISSTGDTISLAHEKSETLTIFNPSQPNSSLLRLTGDGNVQLGHYLQKMEEVRGHLNNAVCTMLQSTIILTLPYLKLLSGDQLDNLCCQNFCEEWIQIIAIMAQNLKSESRKEVDTMLKREYRTLLTESTQLYKMLQKQRKKIGKMFQDNEREGTPALQRLQPKNLPRFRGRRVNNNVKNNSAPPPAGINTTIQERTVSPPPSTKKLQFAPVQLTRASISVVDLYKQHIFLSKSKKGYLVFKNKIDDEWKRFSELSFNNRREIFLHVVDDLHWTIKLGFNIAVHVKELFVEGYPESVSTNLQEILKYIKKVSKEEDLLMLSKVTIVKQIKSLYETQARLVQALKNAKTIAKCFSKCLQSTLYAKSNGPTFWRKKVPNPFISSDSASLTRDNCEFNMNLSLRLDNSRAKLLIPYHNSVNPFLD